jgi:hypothetical protein
LPAIATGIVDKEHVVTLFGEMAGVEFQTVDVSKVPQSKDFALDPTGNVVPIVPKPVAKSDLEPLSDLLGCTLAVMSAQENLAASRG